MSCFSPIFTSISASITASQEASEYRIRTSAAVEQGSTPWWRISFGIPVECMNHRSFCLLCIICLVYHPSNDFPALPNVSQVNAKALRECRGWRSEWGFRRAGFSTPVENLFSLAFMTARQGFSDKGCFASCRGEDT